MNDLLEKGTEMAFKNLIRHLHLGGFYTTLSGVCGEMGLWKVTMNEDGLGNRRKDQYEERKEH